MCLIFQEVMLTAMASQERLCLLEKTLQSWYSHCTASARNFWWIRSAYAHPQPLAMSACTCVL